MTSKRLDDSMRLRRCVFRPYRRGMGPVFTLTTWDTGRTDRRGQTVIGYRLTMRTERTVHTGLFPNMAIGPDGVPLPPVARKRVTSAVLFEGEDFAGSPLHADDSDATVASLMGFLTLRPGDTDADFFASDTEAQRDYRECHAEALAMAVHDRFGEV